MKEEKPLKVAKRLTSTGCTWFLWYQNEGETGKVSYVKILGYDRIPNTVRQPETDSIFEPVYIQQHVIREVVIDKQLYSVINPQSRFTYEPASSFGYDHKLPVRIN